ncbi:MAG: orotidine-5'-phosphate decarboxylase [Bacteroidetes bacterium]|nr:orotidine-5'-phosphate decarboxylase [Bacteroidota bacterium]
MNFISKLSSIRKKNQSNLIVGLDTDPLKIPDVFHSSENPALEFNKAVIDSTKDICAGYKLNVAFYENLEEKGVQALRETLRYIPEDLLTICDAKRGDLDNSAENYASVYFDKLGFDSITISPYMGTDSVIPFIKRKDKHVFVLALTSNRSSSDFELLKSGDKYLYQHVTEKFLQTGDGKNIGFVFGANYVSEISDFTSSHPEVSLLIPGIGAQGNDLDELMNNLNSDNFLINSSRDIIYAAGKDDDPDLIKEKIRTAALRVNENINGKRNRK